MPASLSQLARRELPVEVRDNPVVRVRADDADHPVVDVAEDVVVEAVAVVQPVV